MIPAVLAAFAFPFFGLLAAIKIELTSNRVGNGWACLAGLFATGASALILLRTFHVGWPPWSVGLLSNGAGVAVTALLGTTRRAPP